MIRRLWHWLSGPLAVHRDAANRVICPNCDSGDVTVTRNRWRTWRKSCHCAECGAEWRDKERWQLGPWMQDGSDWT